VIFAIGFGAPALRLPFVSSQSAAVYGVAALVLSYSAYVSEVYRAGLNSVHRARSPRPARSACRSGRRCGT
jgi:polar amino acid transport system permease protein